MSLRPKRILFGVSGGIAAYKAPDLLHGWVKLGFDVETVLTEAAEQFVSPLALSTLSKRRVWRERDFLSAEYGWQIPHISLTDWADLFVIAPCTANVLRAAAQGDGSTLLGAALLANTKPLLLFPAMNGKMLASGPVQEHIKILKERGAEIVDPDSGLLACGYEGKGRMPSAAVINDYVMRALCDKKDFAGRRVAVTAGPTHEYIDSALHQQPEQRQDGLRDSRRGVAARRGSYSDNGADGPSPSSRDKNRRGDERGRDVRRLHGSVGKRRRNRKSRRRRRLQGRRARGSEDKARRQGDADARTRTEPRYSGGARPAQEGRAAARRFAAETQNVLENAQKKMAEKNLDMIVSNDVLAPGAGFAVDTNSVTIMARGAEPVRFSGTKDETASRILDSVSRSPPGNNAVGSRRISGPLVDAALLLVGDGSRRGASRIRAARQQKQSGRYCGRRRRLRQI